MMRAHFRAATPDAVEMTLTMTAPVSEWRRLKGALEKGGPEAGELGRAVGKLIAQADASLAAERWTTGYAVGVVGEASE